MALFPIIFSLYWFDASDVRVFGKLLHLQWETYMHAPCWYLFVIPIPCFDVQNIPKSHSTMAERKPSLILGVYLLGRLNSEDHKCKANLSTVSTPSQKTNQNKQNVWGVWVSMKEYLPNILKDLSLVSSTAKKRNDNTVLEYFDN